MIGALYARASIDHPSTRLQLSALQELALDLGLGGCAHYVDEADEPSRPALAHLIEAVRAGRIDAILVTRLSRLAWSVRHLGDLLEQLGDTRLISLEEDLDTHTRRGRIGAQHFVALARFDREVASETTRTAHVRARAKGVRLGRPPLTTPRHKLATP